MNPVLGLTYAHTRNTCIRPSNPLPARKATDPNVEGLLLWTSWRRKRSSPRWPIGRAIQYSSVTSCTGWGLGMPCSQQESVPPPESTSWNDTSPHPVEVEEAHRWFLIPSLPPHGQNMDRWGDRATENFQITLLEDGLPIISK